MLKVLPENISILIAAGEVIQRPASVVKELLENSIDAKATSITMIINDYGKTLIQVIDNGIGMNAKEAELCFLSHATSKIDTIEDLSNISTFGFRGEALASIAACSDVTLKTRKRGEDVGTQVHIASGKLIKVSPATTPEGCNIAVRNIFYNIPARRKFLKSDNSEYKQILNEFFRVALTATQVEFKFIHNSKEIYNLHAGESLKQRIASITGSSLIKISKELLDVQVDTSVVKINGYVGTPTSAKKTQGNNYLFVNGRFFRSPILHKAIIKGFSNIIPQEYTPSYYIFLEVNPGEIDVNISPSKTEIKFENENAIFQILEATVKETIGKNAFAPIIDFDTEGVPSEIATLDGFTLSPKEKEMLANKSFKKPQINYDPLFNPFKKNTLEEQGLNFEYSSSHFGNNNNQFDQMINIDNNLVALKHKDGEGLIIVNIARARERIQFEDYMNSLASSKPAIQEDLFPKTISLDQASYDLIINSIDLMKTLGFEVRAFGNNCIVVSGTPAVFNSDNIDIEESIEEIANLISDKNNNEPIENSIKESFFEKVALKIVSHTNFKLSNEPTLTYINELYNNLIKCKEPATAPSGGYCFTTISTQQIKKQLT